MVYKPGELFNFEGTLSKRKQKGNTLTAKYGNPVAIAKRIHLYPSRTQKLSSLALKILGGQPPGKLGRRRFFFLRRFHYGIFFFYVKTSVI